MITTLIKYFFLKRYSSADWRVKDFCGDIVIIHIETEVLWTVKSRVERMVILGRNIRYVTCQFSDNFGKISYIKIIYIDNI